MCWAVEVLSATVIEEVQIALPYVLWWKKGLSGSLAGLV